MLNKSVTALLTTAAVAAAVVGTLAQQPPTPAGRQGAPGGGRGGPPPPGGFPRVPSLPFPESPQELELSGTKYRVVPIAKGLVNPWSLTFLPNGDMLVTEKPGRLRIVRKGVLDPQAIAGTPEVVTQGQGGLLEVLPHPQFATNQYLYLTYSKACADGSDDRSAARQVRRQGADRGQRPVRGRQLQYRQPALRIRSSPSATTACST